MATVFLENRARIAIVQELVQNHSRACEVYYVEYRVDENDPCWKFFKKAQRVIPTRGKREE